MEGTKKKDAQEELRATEDMVSKGIYIPIKKMTLFAEVAEDWLEYKKPNLRITTWEVCKGHTQNHFEALNNLKINQITIANV